MTKFSRVLYAASAVFLTVGLYATTVSGKKRSADDDHGKSKHSHSGGGSDSGTDAEEAPTGFDGQTNGLVEQATFEADRATFEERDNIEKGLGPVYNTQSCAECHQTPVTGGSSQIVELRAGPNHAGGSLINSRATDPEIQEHVSSKDRVVAFRASQSLLGDGYVEAIGDETLRAIARAQPAHMRGEVIEAPVLEAQGFTRVGRFGWKAQLPSLLSFASDAYLNEVGITNRFNLVENTSDGTFVGFGTAFDLVDDGTACKTARISPDICGEDPDDDIYAFARFIRATKAPSRGPITADVIAGSTVFDNVGCNICHVRNIVTGQEGLLDTFPFDVPAALANKLIHPFSDFLLHDIGTGDGIVQGPASTKNKMKTAPLWGLRTRGRLMHDELSVTLEDAIERHQNEAGSVEQNFDRLSAVQKRQLLAFLKSL